MHLRPPAAAGCVGQCVSDCPRCQFHQALDAPLTAEEQKIHARFQQRIDSLMRGDIPA
jgi:hypothetical protein